MKPPYYDSDLIQTLQLSGEYIGNSDQPDKYAAWVLFLIDEIKGFAAEDQYAAMLDELSTKVVALRNESNV
ncbi:MAG: hypothetical protein R3293_09695 [Candidatus Promineifilaceae bacterium]|nr:hypothetical protein [Candidatus Promineifilaceae bacterium]